MRPTPETDAIVEPEIDMDGARLLVRFDQLARHAKTIERQRDELREKLAAAAKKPGVEGKRARLAETLKKMHRK